jgi:hypothetical protein
MKRVLIVEFVQQKTTMSEVYCETLKKLRQAIQNKRHGMLTSGVMLFYDNVCLRTASHTRVPLKHFNH